MNTSNDLHEATPNTDDLNVMSTLLEHIKGLRVVSGGPMSDDDIAE